MKALQCRLWCRPVHSTKRTNREERLCVCVSQVREAQLAQYNYILVVGEAEQAAKTVNVRTRDNVVHGMWKVRGRAVRLSLLTLAGRLHFVAMPLALLAS